MSLTRALIALALVAAPAVAHAQFVDRTVVVPPPAEDAPAEDARPPRTASAEPPAKLEVRLTLSSQHAHPARLREPPGAPAPLSGCLARGRCPSPRNLARSPESPGGAWQA